jgi:hypothetical protein
MIPGIVVAMGGQDWTIPPLTLGQLRELMPRVQQLAGLDATQMGDAQLKTLIEIVTAALRRNYPDTTADLVENILDLGNALPVLDAILGGGKLPANGEKSAYEPGYVYLPGQGPLEPAAPEGQPAAEPAPWPWRPNPPVVGS